MPKLRFGSRGGMYYIKNGRKVYVKRSGHKNSFGMDYASPGVLGGLGEGYVQPSMMSFGGWADPEDSWANSPQGVATSMAFGECSPSAYDMRNSFGFAAEYKVKQNLSGLMGIISDDAGNISTEGWRLLESLKEFVPNLGTIKTPGDLLNAIVEYPTQALDAATSSGFQGIGLVESIAKLPIDIVQATLNTITGGIQSGLGAVGIGSSFGKKRRRRRRY